MSCWHGTAYPSTHANIQPKGEQEHNPFTATKTAYPKQCGKMLCASQYINTTNPIQYKEMLAWCCTYYKYCSYSPCSSQRPQHTYLPSAQVHGNATYNHHGVTTANTQAQDTIAACSRCMPCQDAITLNHQQSICLLVHPLTQAASDAAVATCAQAYC